MLALWVKAFAVQAWRPEHESPAPTEKAGVVTRAPVTPVLWAVTAGSLATRLTVQVQ